MAMQVFAAEELARLREFPDISREELFRHFTLTPADIAFLTPGRRRGPAERLGLSVALCALPRSFGRMGTPPCRPHHYTGVCDGDDLTQRHDHHRGIPHISNSGTPPREHLTGHLNQILAGTRS